MAQSSGSGNGRHDPRRAALHSWLAAQLGAGEFETQPASGDASFRRYFRVRHAGRSWIAMDAPPEHEDCRPYVAVAERLREHGLNAPRVRHRDLDRGFLLLDDLGDMQYLSSLDESTAERLYGDALEALFVMQTTVPASELPPYDEALLRGEMQLFVDWFLGRHLGLDLTGEARAVIDRTFRHLVDSALEQPRVFVHRDYHSRNLMVCEPDNPGILDFQDAVCGPVTYDLVSLLRDCYIAWPDERVRGWTDRHYRRLLESATVDADAETFRRWFDWMGAQRHLKAIGIFARLNHRDGKPAYLGDIPRTFSYLDEVCSRWPELGGFHRLLGELRIAERLPG